jgi:hypothetical protein
MTPIEELAIALGIPVSIVSEVLEETFGSADD